MSAHFCVYSAFISSWPRTKPVWASGRDFTVKGCVLINKWNLTQYNAPFKILPVFQCTKNYQNVGQNLFEKIRRGSHVHKDETCKSSEFALAKKTQGRTAWQTNTRYTGVEHKWTSVGPFSLTCLLNIWLCLCYGNLRTICETFAYV